MIGENTRKQASFATVSPCLVLVISLFFMWGFANNLNDILIQQFKKAFVLSDFESSLVQSAFYLGYFFFAIPAAIIMQKFGYKQAIVGGLLLYACGALLFLPAAEHQEYTFFLIALFVIASGLAFLEASANPFIVKLGPPETAQQRLNFAQSFNPLGSITGVLVGQSFIFTGVEYSQQQLAAFSLDEKAAYLREEALTLQVPYLIIGCTILLWAALFLFLKIPKQVNEAPASFSLGGFRSGMAALMQKPHFRATLLAQFCYVGAQVGVWSFLIRYTLVNQPEMTEKAAANMLSISLVLFIIGRFVGTALMSKMEGRKLMAIFALGNTVLCGFAMFVGGKAGAYALVLVSFGMSIMFPTIFAMGIAGAAEHSKMASSLLIMTIIGGAILTAVMGMVSDLSGISAAFAVPAACFVVVAWFALSGYKNKSVAHR
ncbi:L-fucose:H+ symporter permease [Alteromonas pelagimontana]|uniref:L-fucose:H+ symporter permease n=1 Tax=Alteromonas pelagimontana TaxID=1858656 RepID=A0A6M4MGF1_9ALTE|nr:L-fucose:H+ symporter permease [Alteromonas pelagimontana]QJR82271.1 L-fucose:H+ symporter permease [Alteromonas pelagimontana]